MSVMPKNIIILPDGWYKIKLHAISVHKVLGDNTGDVEVTFKLTGVPEADLNAKVQYQIQRVDESGKSL